MNEKYIITIGRQLGSGGRIVGEQLAQKLAIGFYDKELIIRASRESGVAPAFFENADEKINPLLTGGLVGGLFQDNYVSNETLFKLQSDAMRAIADKESAVFVGRCADCVLREYSRTVHIFISANLEDRVSRVANYYTLSEEKALALIEKTDKKRASFYNYYSTKSWGVANSYDLCVNSSLLGVEDTTDFVFDFVKRAIM